jgi:anhydro-N-acetylmuramic acid kinase
VDADGLEALLAHPYFAAPPPKSLDRDDFAAHARALLRPESGPRLSPADGAATLTAFTAAAVARALDHMPEPPRSWIAAGGGSHNAALIGELRARLGAARLLTAAEAGWSPDFVEAQAFAYLAARSLAGLPLTFPGTTGVPRPLPGGRFAEPPGQAALSAGARPSRRSR